ncbi:hypothetical protein JCM6882_002103 [Rhodosporidiobolus microsporus]
MADDLFSPAPSDSPAASPSLAADSPASAPSTATTAPAAAAPAFVPRAIKRKGPPVRRAGAAALLAAQGGAATSGGSGSNTASTSTAAPNSTAAAAPAPAPPHATSSQAAPPKTDANPPLAPQERDRLEAILQAVESALSDWGLSSYGRGGEVPLLDVLERGAGWVHISQVVKVQAVRALTGSMGDVQSALKLRDSPVVQLDESGYKVGRQTSPDYERLRTMDLSEWDDCVVYLENIPYLPSLDSHSLPLFLASLSASTASYPQKLVLPPLFDKENPPSLSPSDDESDPSKNLAPSQAELFAQSRRGSEAAEGKEDKTKKARQLPKGGGPFKGFAFVVLGSKEEAERVTAEWKWEREEGTAAEQVRDGEEAEPDGEGEDEKMEGMEAGEGEKKGKKGKGKEKKKLSPVERARRSGMRALSYTRYLALKNEYLTYRRSLETLLDAQQSGELDRLRNPPTRDRPPHLSQRDQRAPPSSVAPGSSTTKKQQGNKRAASPTSPLFDNGAPLPPSSSAIDSGAPQSKRRKRASSPTGGATAQDPLAQRIARLPTPPPAVDLSSTSALSIRGAFPELCVLWVRNVHEKSTKTSLKALFGALLESLQEGSGKGVEFVDYEKGTEMCYLRFSSSALASLILAHLSQTPSLHASQTSLTPLSSDPPNPDFRRPVVAELLTGEQERRYWAAVPEATRKKAREAAGGRVGLVKEPKAAAAGPGGVGDEEEDRPPVLPTRNKDGKVLYTAWTEEWEEKPDVAGGEGGAAKRAAQEADAEEKPKKRKRPSRL